MRSTSTRPTGLRKSPLELVFHLSKVEFFQVYQYWVEIFTLGTFLYVASSLLFSEPLVGVRNTGDVIRPMARAGIGYVSSHQAGDVDSRFLIVERDKAWLHRQEYITSVSLLVGLAVGLDEALLPDGYLSVRSVGAVNLAIFMVGLALIVFANSTSCIASRASLCLSLLFMFSDVGYLAYANSLYSEFPALSFLLVSIGAFLISDHAVLISAKCWIAGLFCASAILFIFAKPQYAICGLPLSWLCYRLLERSKLKWLVCVLLIALSLMWAVEGQPDQPRYANVFNWLFYDMLKHSPDRVGDMNVLGIKPQYESVIGRGYPDQTLTDDQRDAAKGKSHIDIARFCLRRPGRCLDMVERHARASADIRPEWYFEKVDAMKVKWSSPWGGIRRDLRGVVNLWWLVLLAVVNLMVGAIGVRRTGRKGWGRAQIVLVIMSALQFFSVSFGEGENDIAKHLFLFSGITDLLLAILLSAVLHRDFWLGRGEQRDERRQQLAGLDPKINGASGNSVDQI